MSENSEDSMGDNEENGRLSGESENGLQFDYVEETLQITDVHELFNQTADVSPHKTVDLRSTDVLQTSAESPFSVQRFLNETPRIETTLDEAQDLQSELAALGFNSHYTPAEKVAESSFEQSFERSSFENNQMKMDKINMNVIENDNCASGLSVDDCKTKLDEETLILKSRPTADSFLEEENPVGFNGSTRQGTMQSKSYDSNIPAINQVTSFQKDHNIEVVADLQHSFETELQNIEKVEIKVLDTNNFYGSLYNIVEIPSEFEREKSFDNASINGNERVLANDSNFSSANAQSTSNNERFVDLEQSNSDSIHEIDDSKINENEVKTNELNRSTNSSSEVIADIPVLKENIQSEIYMKESSDDDNDDVFEDAVVSFKEEECISTHVPLKYDDEQSPKYEDFYLEKCKQQELHHEGEKSVTPIGLNKTVTSETSHSVLLNQSEKLSEESNTSIDKHTDEFDAQETCVPSNNSINLENISEKDTSILAVTDELSKNSGQVSISVQETPIKQCEDQHPTLLKSVSVKVQELIKDNVEDETHFHTSSNENMDSEDQPLNIDNKSMNLEENSISSNFHLSSSPSNLLPGELFNDTVQECVIERLRFTNDSMAYQFNTLPPSSSGDSCGISPIHMQQEIETLVKSKPLSAVNFGHFKPYKATDCQEPNTSSCESNDKLNSNSIATTEKMCELSCPDNQLSIFNKNNSKLQNYPINVQSIVHDEKTEQNTDNDSVPKFDSSFECAHAERDIGAEHSCEVKFFNHNNFATEHVLNEDSISKEIYCDGDLPDYFYTVPFSEHSENKNVTSAHESFPDGASPKTVVDNIECSIDVVSYLKQQVCNSSQQSDSRNDQVDKTDHDLDFTLSQTLLESMQEPRSSSIIQNAQKTNLPSVDGSAHIITEHMNNIEITCGIANVNGLIEGKIMESHYMNTSSIIDSVMVYTEQIACEKGNYKIEVNKELLERELKESSLVNPPTNDYVTNNTEQENIESSNRNMGTEEQLVETTNLVTVTHEDRVMVNTEHTAISAEHNCETGSNEELSIGMLTDTNHMITSVEVGSIIDSKETVNSFEGVDSKVIFNGQLVKTNDCDIPSHDYHPELTNNFKNNHGTEGAEGFCGETVVDMKHFNMPIQDNSIVINPKEVSNDKSEHKTINKEEITEILLVETNTTIAGTDDFVRYNTAPVNNIEICHENVDVLTEQKLSTPNRMSTSIQDDSICHNPEPPKNININHHEYVNIEEVSENKSRETNNIESPPQYNTVRDKTEEVNEKNYFKQLHNDNCIVEPVISDTQNKHAFELITSKEVDMEETDHGHKNTDDNYIDESVISDTQNKHAFEFITSKEVDMEETDHGHKNTDDNYIDESVISDTQNKHAFEFITSKEVDMEETDHGHKNTDDNYIDESVISDTQNKHIFELTTSEQVDMEKTEHGRKHIDDNYIDESMTSDMQNKHILELTTSEQVDMEKTEHGRKHIDDNYIDESMTSDMQNKHILELTTSEQVDMEETEHGRKHIDDNYINESMTNDKQNKHAFEPITSEQVDIEETEHERENIEQFSVEDNTINSSEHNIITDSAEQLSFLKNDLKNPLNVVKCVHSHIQNHKPLEELTTDSETQEDTDILDVPDIYLSEHVEDEKSDGIECDILINPESKISQKNSLEQLSFEEAPSEIRKEINSTKEDITEHVSFHQNIDKKEELLNSLDYALSRQSLDSEETATQDMSMTIVSDVIENNPVSYKFVLCKDSKEENDYVPQSSKSMSNFLKNAYLEETNDFTTQLDQKMFDAMYLPLHENDDNNQSVVSDHGLRSFMEITMANVNPAKIEQNLNIAAKQLGLHHSKRNSVGKEYSEASQCELDEYHSGLMNEPELKDINHEMMQQSICDYVTNRSLQLAIPDSEQLPNINQADEETRQKCERQTENILLMKWPAQFHDELNILKEQNQFLLESNKHKDEYINTLKLDNDCLRKKLIEVNSATEKTQQENNLLKKELNEHNEENQLIVVLQQENESLKNIENDFMNFKMTNEELIQNIERNRMEKEDELRILKDRIEELEKELLESVETVTDIRYQNEELLKLLESLNNKESQIKTLVEDKTSLEEKVSYLSNYAEKTDGLQKENEQMKQAVELEVEKRKGLEELKTLLEKQLSDVCCKNESLTELTSNLNENITNLEEVITKLNRQLEEKCATEESLKSDLAKEKERIQTIETQKVSLEDESSLKNVTIAKLNDEINNKSKEIHSLTNNNLDLAENVENLKQRLAQLNEVELANEQLKITIEQRNKKIGEIEILKDSLEEQVNNLNSQNELLWSQLKVSTTKEQSVYALKEERILLEEKLAQMKKEIHEINKLKSENEDLVDELANRDIEIRNLMADKKKLKSCLVKANDKLNELENEVNELSTKEQYSNDCVSALNQENSLLQNKITEFTKQVEILNRDLEDQKMSLSESISPVSEYIGSLCIEHDFLFEEMTIHENQSKKLLEEIHCLKGKVSEERILFDDIYSQKVNLLFVNDKLKETVAQLTESLNGYKCQCKLVKEENEELILKISALTEEVNLYEEEKCVTFRGLSSMSETICSLLMDEQLLSEQLKVNAELSEQISLLTTENKRLENQIIDIEQNISKLNNSNCSLKSQIEVAKEKDTVISNLESFAKDLEDHVSSLNEELFSEIAKNHSLIMTNEILESQNNEEIIQLQSTITSLSDQFNVLKEKDIVINDLELLVRDLEDHMSSINEELMSEIANHHSLFVINENLESQINKLVEEKLCLNNLISDLEQILQDTRSQNEKVTAQNLDFIREKEFIIHDLNEKHLSFQARINQVSEKNNALESENFKLKHDLNNVQEAVKILHNNNKDLSDLLDSKKSLELKFNSTNEEKVELENKLIAKLSQVELLEDEIKHLSMIVEKHKESEDTIRSLQSEKINLESQITDLLKSVEKLNSEHEIMETYRKDNMHLKEVMTKEIYSLTGVVWDSESNLIVDVYNKLMTEFLNKEQEVILSLESNCESKIQITKVEIVNLKNALDEKEVFTAKLENEIEELKKELIRRNMTISGLENDLQRVKDELIANSSEIVEIKQLLTQAENEKEVLISDLNKLHQSELEENVLRLNNELNCKNNDIVTLKTEIENMRHEKSDLLKHIETEKGVLKQYQDLIAELTSKINHNQELISEMNLQLQNKNNETSQLSEYLQAKESELKFCLKNIEESRQAVMKLHTIENEIDLIQQNLTSSNGEFDGLSLIGSIQSCQFLSDLIKSLVLKLLENTEKLQSSNSSLKLELTKQADTCKTFETQINCLNEELKAHKMLYDEDLLQLKEEISAKNYTITNLNETIEKLKNEHVTALDKVKDLKNEFIEIQNLKEEVNKLREENRNLLSESEKFHFFTEVNRKLSLEIEELSRSFKFEKQSNIDLKAKCDLATNQVADLTRKNFQLEDKIDLLESKLQNHDIMSSLKIVFPFGVNTVDKQVKFINEKLIEFDQTKTKLDSLIEEYNSLKTEYKKSKDYIKVQEDKLSKIMKRELELKKQMASNMQNSSESNMLVESLRSELFPLFPDHNISVSDIIRKIKSLIDKNQTVNNVGSEEIDNLKKKIEEISQDNKDLDSECEMMHKHIKEQEELIATVLKREEELKILNTELKFQLSNQERTLSKSPVVTSTDDLQELFRVFPEKPASLNDCVNLIMNILTENQTLKEKVSESQEEYASLDKECEQMYKAYQEKGEELADVLKREAKAVSDFKARQDELENQLRTLSGELHEANSQLKKQMSPPAQCQCDELKSRLAELKVDIAERNAKITALELRFEADNFPLKKKVADLEKSLDQAKHKINELKMEARRYQEQMCDMTVDLRTECDKCRRVTMVKQDLGSQTSPTPDDSSLSLHNQLAEKNKEISILKGLCKSRKTKITELEQRFGSKMPLSQRSALKEGKENTNVPLSPTKPSKSSM